MGVRKILNIFGLSKFLLRVSTFHLPFVMRSLTLRRPGLGVPRGLIQGSLPKRTQGSSHGLIEDPSPIEKQAFPLITCLALKIPFQTQESAFVFSTDQKFSFRRYLARRILQHREFLPLIRSHPYLANKAVLDSSVRLIPRPPICFGVHKSFQAFQHISLLPLLCPHQKRRSHESISLQRFLGSAMVCIE